MKQTKKQPINVQLSKLELSELLNTLKKFVQEEFLKTSKEDNARMDRIYKSLFNLEEAQKNQAFEISGLNRQLVCGLSTGHTFTLVAKYDYSYEFRCLKCGLSYGEAKHELNKKERKLVRQILGVIIQ